MIQALRVLVLEWQVAAYQAVQNNACAPYVRLWPNVLQSLDQFRRGIARRAAGRHEFLIWLESIAQAKIDNFEVLLLVQQQILRFDISMGDAKLTQILNTRDKLLEKSTSFILLEVVLRCDVIEQLAVAAMLHDQE